jgi:hypothetical protein
VFTTQQATYRASAVGCGAISSTSLLNRERWRSSEHLLRCSLQRPRRENVLMEGTRLMTLLFFPTVAVGVLSCATTLWLLIPGMWEFVSGAVPQQGSRRVSALLKAWRRVYVGSERCTS